MSSSEDRVQAKTPPNIQAHRHWCSGFKQKKNTTHKWEKWQKHMANNAYASVVGVRHTPKYSLQISHPCHTLQEVADHPDAPSMFCLLLAFQTVAISVKLTYSPE